MKRVCIFAHFDKDNIIDDYVIYYLRKLKEVCEYIVFVSDSDLTEQEQKKLSGIVDFIQAYHHGEYDWGSYKFGYIIAKNKDLLKDADELLMCNDSVYGPIKPLDVFFETMSERQADFWGMYKNVFGLDKGIKDPHLQSWFLVVKKQVFNSVQFDNFMKSIVHLKDKLEIIRKYEIGFTREMEKSFVYDYPYSSLESDVVTNAPLKILKLGFPFIKTSALRRYNFDFSLKKLVNSELFNLMKKHSMRFEKPKFFKLMYNNLQSIRKSRKYNLIIRL